MSLQWLILSALRLASGPVLAHLCSALPSSVPSVSVRLISSEPVILPLLLPAVTCVVFASYVSWRRWLPALKWLPALIFAFFTLKVASQVFLEWKEVTCLTVFGMQEVFILTVLSLLLTDCLHWSAVLGNIT